MLIISTDNKNNVEGIKITREFVDIQSRHIFVENRLYSGLVPQFVANFYYQYAHCYNSISSSKGEEEEMSEDEETLFSVLCAT